MTSYLDTSALLQAVLTNELAMLPKAGKVYSSELLLIEANRTLERHRLTQQIRDDELARARHLFNKYYENIEIVSLNRNVLKRASEPFSTVMGTLDAIHLSTAILLRDENEQKLVFLTLDDQLRTGAIAEGFETAA